ncbi:MAG: NADP-binding protein [Alphaproteobacteria bacterium]|nr:NADP-binding protein [Alphaproteobacteria bacterium]
MRGPIRLLVLGTGHMGQGVMRLALERPGLDLAGVFARRPERRGRDAGAVLGLGRDLGVAVETSLKAAIDAARPDIAIQATCSTLADAWDELTVLMHNGVSVVSIAEEMAYPACVSPNLARELDTLAREHGVAVLGTGVNPGFVLDTLVIALTAVCKTVRSVTATRVNDLSPYGPTVLNSQGVGLTPEAFAAGVANGTVVGHVGFPQSCHLIAHALGWTLERIDETREPIVSSVHRETAHVTVKPGQVAGCRHTATAYATGRAVITLVHPQQVLPHLEGVETCDDIILDADPPVHLSGRPEIPGGEATVAIAVNSIPNILNARPGLYTMADLPLPAAWGGQP